MTAATKTKPVEPAPVEPEQPGPDDGTVTFGGLSFESVDVPVVSIASPKTNPYVDAVKSLVGTDKALKFTHTVTDRGVRKDFDKIKRELQDAGSLNDATVRTYIYDADSGNRLVLPAVKQAELKFTDENADVKPEDVTTFRVMFWVAPTKIVRAPATGAGNTPGAK